MVLAATERWSGFLRLLRPGLAKGLGQVARVGHRRQRRQRPRGGLGGGSSNPGPGHAIDGRNGLTLGGGRCGASPRSCGGQLLLERQRPAQGLGGSGNTLDGLDLSGRRWLAGQLRRRRMGMRPPGSVSPRPGAAPPARAAASFSLSVSGRPRGAGFAVSIGVDLPAGPVAVPTLPPRPAPVARQPPTARTRARPAASPRTASRRRLSAPGPGSLSHWDVPPWLGPVWLGFRIKSRFLSDETRRPRTADPVNAPGGSAVMGPSLGL